MEGAKGRRGGGETSLQLLVVQRRPRSARGRGDLRPRLTELVTEAVPFVDDVESVGEPPLAAPGGVATEGAGEAPAPLGRPCNERGSLLDDLCLTGVGPPEAAAPVSVVLHEADVRPLTPRVELHDAPLADAASGLGVEGALPHGEPGEEEGVDAVPVP